MARMNQGDEALCFEPATELAANLERRTISSRQLTESFLEQIARTNDAVNALCTVDAEAALQAAGASDARRSSPEGPRSAVDGMPIAIKDLSNTRGLRTTMGSPIFRDFVPDEDAWFVKRLRDAGAVILGKTNVPEFGAGSQTFNPVFGATRNPWNLEKTVGGSSGGAAAALAARMLPFADGSDLGGSLRNPASFCNVIGMRPTPGRVPSGEIGNAWDDLPVVGPMARNIDDLALLFSAMAGPHPLDPISLSTPGGRYAPPIEPLEAPRTIRLAWSEHLGDLPVEPEVLAVCHQALDTLRKDGFQIEAVDPPLDGADEIFRTLRAWSFASRFAALDREQHQQLKDTVIWNIEQGRMLTSFDIHQALSERNQLYQRFVTFMEPYDALVLPTVQVLPFDVSLDYPREVAGQTCTNYLDWMASCYRLTVTRAPALSMPAGFSDGLPVGLQWVGHPGADLALLQLLKRVERVLPFADARPDDKT